MGGDEKMTRDERRMLTPAEMMESGDRGLPVWQAHMRDRFEYEAMPPKPPKRRAARTRGMFATTSTKMADIAPPATAPTPPANKVRSRDFKQAAIGLACVLLDLEHKAT